MELAGERILQLGDPQLRVPAIAVGEDLGNHEFRHMAERMHRVLAAFRQQRGFGRAIAATQLGIRYRLIALDLGTPTTLVDPVIRFRSPELFSLWDDCLSFPDLLVQVTRHRAIDVEHRDLDGNTIKWEVRDPAVAELLQHEIDHLDGILAVDRASGNNPFALRSQYERHIAGQPPG